MNQPSKWVLGIDPGYGNTGVVLRLASDKGTTAAVCWRNDNVGEWDVLRAQSICIPMMEQVLAWVGKYDIEELEVCVETPFLNRNPGTMIVQMYLFVLLQAYVFDYLVPIVPQVYLTIVHNATSKSKLAHIKAATKSQMIQASEWADYKKRGLTYDQAHTLADAYAHSLSADSEQYDLSAMAQYMVEPNCEVGDE
jgi:Holliday junction resolvasome RuvABC endonuclease subunit